MFLYVIKRNNKTETERTRRAVQWPERCVMCAKKKRDKGYPLVDWCGYNNETCYTNIITFFGPMGWMGA